MERTGNFSGGDTRSPHHLAVAAYTMKHDTVRDYRKSMKIALCITFVSGKNKFQG
ncbi:MAG: hypothetical protein WCJ93_01375 [Methanomicrobiales archaeon]